ncbi:tRNA isopentenyl-2-thiomethyl-A-37 hydroxylase MiaE, partial [Acinetobacter baumannii]
SLGPPPVDAYAVKLRDEAAHLGRHASMPPVVDRLLVAALIEARSCERFKLLIEALDSKGEREVADVYRELFPAEAR